MATPARVFLYGPASAAAPAALCADRVQAAGARPVRRDDRFFTPDQTEPCEAVVVVGGAGLSSVVLTAYALARPEVRRFALPADADALWAFLGAADASPLESVPSADAPASDAPADAPADAPDDVSGDASADAPDVREHDLTRTEILDGPDVLAPESPTAPESPSTAPPSDPPLAPPAAPRPQSRRRR